MKKCKIKGCSRDHAAKGYCAKHYQRYKNGKTFSRTKERIFSCLVEGCERDHCAKGYCKVHYGQFKNGKIPGKIRKVSEKGSQVGCLVERCTNKHSAKGHCRRHYLQMYAYGKIKERTTKEPNEFVFEEDIYKINLYDINSKHIATAIIDAEDYDKVKDVKWHKESGRGYPKSHKKGFLHHVIWGKKVQLDHKDRDKMNARKNNLRLATAKQNMQNRRLSNNTSGYIGVSSSETCHKKWTAQIYYDGKNHRLGRFHTKEEATRAYDKKCFELRGKFAVLNFKRKPKLVRRKKEL